MANNREFYCNHCKKETLFFLESDLLWYCDECANVLDSIPYEDDEYVEDDAYDIGDMELDLHVVRCTFCNNLVRVDDLEEGIYCPVCYEDLSEKVDEEYEENED